MTTLSASTTVSEFASQSVESVLAATKSSAEGLSVAEAATRLATDGPNIISSHRVGALAVLGRQLKNPVLVLLATTAIVSLALGDLSNSLVILFILLLSIGLGFVTEFRAEKANELLHSRVQHSVTVTRGGSKLNIPVSGLVVGDIVDIALGTVIPADLRLLDVTNLETDESIISGESEPSENPWAPSPPARP